MKARDIIPGWPRGRSTVSWKVHLWEESRQPYFFCFYQSYGMHEQAIQEAAYHAGQQAMVNAHFEAYRNYGPSFMPIATYYAAMLFLLEGDELGRSPSLRLPPMSREIAKSIR